MATKPRYFSLDVFRGATVALMILVNNPGTWDHVFSPLLHAQWHGCSPTDLVFPFFLFAVGNAIAFVLPGLKEAGDAIFWNKIGKRTILIFLIGLFLNWWPFFAWQNGALVFREWVDTADSAYGIRIFGVLQRIALAYFFASIIAYYFKPKAIMVIATILLVGYWGLCYGYGGADPYSLGGYFGTAVDIQLVGEAHLYRGEGIAFDPEGLMSTVPSIVQAVFGYLVGLFIKQNAKVDWLFSKVPFTEDKYFRMLSAMMVSGFLILVLGWIWSLGFPINKKIWTSSYVLYTTGLAVLTLGTVIWYVEVQNVRNSLTSFFVVFGKNPLFIYILSSMIPSLLEIVIVNTPKGELNVWEAFYQNICSLLPGPPEVGSLFFALVFLVIMWLIGYMLDKRKIYIKV